MFGEHENCNAGRAGGEELTLHFLAQKNELQFYVIAQNLVLVI